MDELEQHYCAWHQLDGLTENERRVLFGHFNDPDIAYKASVFELRELGLSTKASAAWRQFSIQPERHQAWHKMRTVLSRLEGVRVLIAADTHYPALLRETPDHPPLLYIRGDVAALNMPQLAVVGSRRCSHMAKETAFQFSKTVASKGIAITSGGALGIDAAAHEGALQVGKTIAVMGTGIDGCYPKAHAQLYERICENGTIVSEFRPGVSAKPGHFPRRNRIIAGMAAGTLVVEAALRSGSLITARLALDYNREVFAMPGSINDPRSKGTHALIKQGAKLTESVADIFEEIGAHSTPRPVRPDGPVAQLLESVDYVFTSLELIAQRSKMSVSSLMPQLLELEVSGYLIQDNGGYIRCRY